MKSLTVTSESASTSTVNLVVPHISSCLTILTTASSNLFEKLEDCGLSLTINPVRVTLPVSSSLSSTLIVTQFEVTVVVGKYFHVCPAEEVSQSSVTLSIVKVISSKFNLETFAHVSWNSIFSKSTSEEELDGLTVN
jgi:hypothetical protein